MADADDVLLLHAVQRGDLPEVTACLARGARPIAVDSDGWTALHWAALPLFDSDESAPFMRALVRGGAVVDARTLSGETPLHICAFNKGGHSCRFLLSVGADVHAVADRGCTPLHFSANAGSVDCIAQLLDAGADVHCLSASGETPAELAAHHAPGAAALLREAARWWGLRRLAVASWVRVTR